MTGILLLPLYVGSFVVGFIIGRFDLIEKARNGGK